MQQLETGSRLSSTKQTAWFLVGRTESSEPIRHIPIHAFPFTIGRRAPASLQIPNLKVSSKHCEIVEDEGQLFVRDLGSTNGTFINGNKIDSPTTLSDNHLIQVGEVVFRVMRQDTQRDEVTAGKDVIDEALALVQFDRLMKENSVIPHYQPIVTLQDKNVIGYEVLGRSRILGLETAPKMFDAASRLNLETELSRMLRWKGIEMSSAFPNPTHLFVNMHATELLSNVCESIARLRELNGKQKLTLEIHEAAVSDVKEIHELQTALRKINVSVAYDAFGSGQNRLVELSDCPPDYLKFDMSLVRNIDTATKEKQQMVSSLVQLAKSLDITTIALGIETQGEADCCKALEFEMGQGFFYGRPTAIHKQLADIH